MDTPVDIPVVLYRKLTAIKLPTLYETRVDSFGYGFYFILSIMPIAVQTIPIAKKYPQQMEPPRPIQKAY